LAGIAPGRLAFLDGSGIDTRLTRPHARARPARWARGQPCALEATAPDPDRGLGPGRDRGAGGGRGRRWQDGLRRAIEGALAPAPKRRPEAVPVPDDLPVHEAPAVRAALDQAGISHRHLPAHSPDSNPMEPCRAKLKAYFRTRAARSLEALEAEPPSALRTVTPGNAQGWFRHCRYLPG
jgi:hypothetical protein